MASIVADILLVTVTKVESKAVLDVFQEATKEKARPIEIEGRTYFSLGTINAVPVFMTQSEMGTSGLDSSMQTVLKGIESLSPAAVIMVGIAFGVDEGKQAHWRHSRLGESASLRSTARRSTRRPA
jgi:nucleoside phosphorylase